MTIKGISTKFEFEIINPKEGSSSFPDLVGRLQGRKMKSSISLEKERIKIKGNGKKVIIPIHPSQGEPWIEPINDDFDVRKLYNLKNNKYYTKPNTYRELHLGNPDSFRYNSGTYLYD